MGRWGIRKKVLVLALVPNMILLLLLGLFFTHSWIDSLHQGLREQGQTMSRQLATAVGNDAVTDNPQSLSSLANAMLREQDVRAITLYDAEKRELAHSGPRGQMPREALAEEQPLENIYGPLHLPGAEVSVFITPAREPALPSSPAPSATVATGDNPAPLGWAVVEMSHAGLDKERYRVLMIAAVLIGASLLLSVLLALRLSRSLMDPIQALTRTTSLLREGRLETRVYTDGGPELEQLESGLNAMARALSRGHNEMQKNVDQATEDLRETLETIEIQNIELDLARKQALEASRIKSEFLANMSHEIRTPLNGIIGFTELLLKTPASRQQKDHLDTIRKSSEILLTIINDILDFSKIEAGKLVLDRVPFHLRDIIEDVLVMLAPAAHEKDLDLVSMVYHDVPDALVGDPLRVKQVLTNLVNNAIKFTQTGEVVVRAMLDEVDGEEAALIDSGENPMEPGDGSGSLCIRLSITDTGVGLSRAQQQSLFSAFNQADASTARQYGGTGLGLVISRRLVEEMGGKISLESELGQGSTFWFTLVTNLAGPDGESPEPAILKGLEREPVLYLEQQAATGLALEHQLKWWGMTVERVRSAREVLDRVQQAQSLQQGYAVVMIGLSRHLLGSSQYRQLIRRLETDCQCRVLLLTPTLHEGQDTIVHLASEHLSKPVRRERLYRALFRLIHGHYPKEVPVPEPTPGLPRAADQERPPRVLAVDDNEANLKLLVTLLQELALSVDQANSGYQALSLLQQDTYDLVFMDVQMPGMDGVECTRRIRQLNNANRRVPVIALTAHALAEEQERLLASGLDGYLTKPINQSLIRETIGRRTGYHFPQYVPVSGFWQFQESQSLRPSKRITEASTVDLQEALQLAGGRADLAQEMLEMLLSQLPEDRRVILTSLEQGDYDSLLERVHRLHGACRYCGVPVLRQQTAALETALKQKQEDSGPLTKALLEAITTLEIWCRDNDWQQKLWERV